MNKLFSGLRPADAIPRILMDFGLVHLSMLLALGSSALYNIAVHGPEVADQVIGNFSAYYLNFFWPLSGVFPVVFFLHGFYTHSRYYRGRYKALVVVQGVGTALLVFLAANYFLFRGQLVARSAALAFAPLAVISLTGVRFAKSFVVRHFDITPKTPKAVFKGTGRVLVVGGAGYIGSLLVRRLLERGYSVRVLDALLYGDWPLKDVLDDPNLEFVVGDCRNIQDVVKAVRGVESVVHLAAIVGDPACELDHQSALEINYAATRMLVEVAKGNGVGRFLFASSCSVYGATDAVMDEHAAVAPISLYGQTKVDSEDALLRARTAAFHPTILRYATVFGLGYRPRFDLVVNLLTAKARQDGVITIYNGQQWRPFIHVRDLVEATVRVLEAPLGLVSGEIYNIGDSRMNHTLSEVAEVIRQVFPETRVEHVENSDRRNYRVSFEKLESRLGFRARYSLRDGVEELKKAFDEGLIEDYTDLRYHNQRFLKVAGTPRHKDRVDALVMAAFASPALEAKAAAAGG